MKLQKNASFTCFVEACGVMKPGSVLLLVARSETLLQELKEELRGSGTPQLVVRCVAVDLSTADGVNKAVEVVSQEAVTDLDHVLLFNNAGKSLLKSVTKQSNKTVLFHATPR